LNENTMWTMVDLEMPTCDCEIIADELWAIGVMAVEEIHSSTATTILRTNLGHNPNDQLTDLLARFPQMTSKIVHIAKEVSETWRQHAVPTWITSEIVIVPEWQEAPIAKHVIRIDPIDTFGLGNHPSTMLALRLAAKNIPHKSVVYDFGCGSGVLGISLNVIHGCTAIVYDIAETARNTVLHNALINNAQNIVWGSPIELVVQGSCDAAVTNILAPVLRHYASSLEKIVKINGFIILSGMRSDQADSVAACFHESKEIEREEFDGWCAVTLLRQGVATK